MTRSLRGTLLELNDAPARLRDVFVVDGNNLAHRAFHALPEGIATSAGLPSNALLGFTNVLFKLLVTYRPRALLVAWDRKPTERLAAATDYKAGRKPMHPRLLEQFPHFPDIVTAFGYPNVAVAGWEADDVLATLATKAEAAALTTCLVTTDRDAMSLVSPQTCLMMTPRSSGAAEVYTPERITQRYGIAPTQIPAFIALKGDAADNIAPVPGIGEKTAAELLIKYGSLEEILAHAHEQPATRRRALEGHADHARASLRLATLRRDLPLDDAVDPRRLVDTKPDRTSLAATLTRFEFRRVLDRLHLLDEALPAQAACGTSA